jgi:hypothetical protein
MSRFPTLKNVVMIPVLAAMTMTVMATTTTKLRQRINKRRCMQMATVRYAVTGSYLYYLTFCTKANRATSKEERTADIRTIFIKVTDHVNTDTGKTMTGHRCMVCKYVDYILCINAL